MTEQQAKQIREMREQGIGYRSIALTVGLSRDIVRNFCKSRGLSGYGSALTKNIREGMNIILTVTKVIHRFITRKRWKWKCNPLLARKQMM